MLLIATDLREQLWLPNSQIVSVTVDHNHVRISRTGFREFGPASHALDSAIPKPAAANRRHRQADRGSVVLSLNQPTLLHEDMVIEVLAVAVAVAVAVHQLALIACLYS
ncbi:MAG: hypothetical protein V5B35_14190 [Candidatus Accumulibacter necessarius]|uniref:hypothetical protein n=1 Tax=Candidatus Accumulibacter necessarius TaxID=2954386 RepID=UPI002FC31599